MLTGVLAFGLLPGTNAEAALPAHETSALVALYNATGGASWNQQTNWLGSPGTECNWFGVTCDGTGSHVLRLELIDNNLAGPLPTELWDLSELTILNFVNNQLTGSLSADVGDLTDLRSLNLEGNALSGSLPPELGDLQSLEHLLLSSNGFTGSIPAELGDLPSIQRILLGGNALTGGIPAALNNATTLSGLSLGNNDLSGPIPDLSGLSGLEGLSLNGNDLSGPIPAWIAGSTDLVAVRLAGNQLTGSIPTDWQNLQLLIALDLADNQLTGSIPSNLGQLAALEYLGLQNNQLTGSIPVELGDLAQLTHLVAQNNQLTGSIPPELGDLLNLTDLNLGQNPLTGTLPVELGDLAALETLAIYNTQISGSLPTELGDLANLKVLSLSGNQLSGTIPASIGGLAQLSTLNLATNQLTGPIPAGLSGQTQMQFLFLGSNQLTGSIPDLSALVELRDVRLDRNQLTGSIPSILDPLDQVTRFDLSNNLLSGSIPLDIGGMSALTDLLLNNNQLSGAIPSTLGNLSNLKVFFANDNQLTGTLPPEINQLTALTSLNVIDNRLDGSLPYMADMTSLVELFFSSNGFTDVDPSLAGLTGIQSVRAELNKLDVDDASAVAFLDARQAGWADTQTVAPESVTAQAINPVTVEVAWDPITYQAQTGGYIVSYGTSPGGPYPSSGGMTADKSASSLQVAGLNPETTYYFVVQSQTDAHAGNQRTLISSISAEASATTPSDDLLAHWPLDETAGTIAEDVTIHNHDGTVVGGPARPIGQIGGAYDFDGSNGYVVVQDPGVWDLDLTNALTLALWIRPDNLQTRQMLMSKDNAYELQIGGVQDFEDHWSARFNNGSAVVSDSPLSAGVWQHVAVTWDGSTVRLYRNGLPDGTAALAGPITVNDTDFGFGARPPGLIGATLFYDGGMDDVRIYDSALTEAEVAALFTPADIAAPIESNASPASQLPLGTTATTLSLDTDEAADCRYDTTPGTAFSDMIGTFGTTGGISHSTPVAGLVDSQIYSYYVRCEDAYGNVGAEDFAIHFSVSAPIDLAAGLLGDWSFDEGTGCVAADSTSLRDGTLGGDCAGGDVPQWITGRVSNGLSFDGDDRVAAAGTGALSEVSVAAWVRIDATTGYMAVLDQRQSGADGFNLFVEPGERLFMRVNGSVLTGQTDIVDGQWHLVMGTYDGNEMKLYVDGFEDAQATIGASSIDTAGVDLQIGGHFNDPQFSFSGDLDEVRLYDRGLDAFEALEMWLLTP